jgi:hypothetical protein
MGQVREAVVPGRYAIWPTRTRRCTSATADHLCPESMQLYPDPDTKVPRIHAAPVTLERDRYRRADTGLADLAKALLRELSCDNVTVIIGDGSEGCWMHLMTRSVARGIKCRAADAEVGRRQPHGGAGRQIARTSSGEENGEYRPIPAARMAFVPADWQGRV